MAHVRRSLGQGRRAWDPPYVLCPFATAASTLALTPAPLAEFDTLKTILSVIAVPIEGLVSVLYWGMRLIDPTLLVPPNPEFGSSLPPRTFRKPARKLTTLAHSLPSSTAIPVSLDLAIHFLPALFLWSDFLAFSPRMSAKVRPERIALVATVAYCSWMEFAAHKNAASHGGTAFFPYPFLNTMKPGMRLGFYVCQVPVLIGLFYAANGVHRLVRGKDGGVQADAAKKLE